MFLSSINFPSVLYKFIMSDPNQSDQNEESYSAYFRLIANVLKSNFQLNMKSA